MARAKKAKPRKARAKSKPKAGARTRPRSKAKTRSTPRRPRGEGSPLTPAQDNRYSLMRRAGVDRTTISSVLADRGIDLTRQSVGNVIRNRFVNDDVINVFCELTKSTRAEAWPDVPLVDPNATPELDAEAIDRVRDREAAERRLEDERALEAREQQTAAAAAVGA